MMSPHESVQQVLTNWIHTKGLDIKKLGSSFVADFIELFVVTLEMAVAEKTKADRDDLEQRFVNMTRAASAGHVEAVHKHLCAETQLAEAQRQLTAMEERLRLALAEETAAKKQAGEYGEALAKISAIRDSIIGTQSINWSEHIYPLVAALNSAGFVGTPYATARVNMSTLIERHDAMEKLATTALLALAEAEKEFARLYDSISSNSALVAAARAPLLEEIARLNDVIDNGSESNTDLIIERDRLKAALGRAVAALQIAFHYVRVAKIPPADGSEAVTRERAAFVQHFTEIESILADPDSAAAGEAWREDKEDLRLIRDRLAGLIHNARYEPTQASLKTVESLVAKVAARRGV